jgi:hypothetical protein
MSVYFDGDHFWLPPLPAAPTHTPKVCPAAPVSDWARAELNFHADPVQAELLNAPAHRLAVCCTRQWGKSTVAAIKALHLAWSRPGAFILFAAPTFEQSVELLRLFRRFASLLTGEPCQPEPGRRGALTLANGSRVLALPHAPDSVRSLAAPDLIVIDDAAFVSDDMHHALTPTLAVSDGQLWLLSTPNGLTGEFHRVWHSAATDWRRFSVTAGNCPRIGQAFLQRERLVKGAPVFNREYMCDFNAAETTGISPETIAAAFRGAYPAANHPTIISQ